MTVKVLDPEPPVIVAGENEHVIPVGAEGQDGVTVFVYASIGDTETVYFAKLAAALPVWNVVEFVADTAGLKSGGA